MDNIVIKTQNSMKNQDTAVNATKEVLKDLQKDLVKEQHECDTFHGR